MILKILSIYSVLLIFSLFVNNKTFRSFLVVLAITVIALLASTRPYNTSKSWDRNDSYNYYKYSYCLNDLNRDYCDDLITVNTYELAIYVLSYISNFFSQAPYLLFFVISWLFMFSYYYLFSTISSRWAVCFMLIFPLLNIFWEANFNILRNALSISFFNVAIALFINKSSAIKVHSAYLFSVISHTSGVIYLFLLELSKRLNVKVAIIAFSLIFLFSHFILDALLFTLNSIPVINATTIPGKIYRYTQATDEYSFSISTIGKIYSFCICYLTFIYSKVKEDYSYGLLLKLLLLCLSLGFVFGGTSVTYRIINIYTPFIFYLSFLAIKNKVLFSKINLGLALLWAIYYFYLSYNVFTRFLY